MRPHPLQYTSLSSVQNWPDGPRTAEIMGNVFINPEENKPHSFIAQRDDAEPYSSERTSTKIINNTFVDLHGIMNTSDSSYRAFLEIARDDSRGDTNEISNNIFYHKNLGDKTVRMNSSKFDQQGLDPDNIADISGSNNWLHNGYQSDRTSFTDDILDSDPGFIPGVSYALGDNSAAVDKGSNSTTLSPGFQYVEHSSFEPRSIINDRVDIGAFERDPSTGTVYRVGFRQEYSKISDVQDLLQPGDRVELYSDITDSIRLNNSGSKESPIVIRGMGEKRPKVFCPDASDGGSDYYGWRIAGSWITIEHIETHSYSEVGRRDKPHSGIYYRGENIVINDSIIHDFRNGVMYNATTSGKIHIKNSEIYSCGWKPGWEGGGNYGHNLYLGSKLGSLGPSIVENSYIHDSRAGEAFKSRVTHGVIFRYNWVENGADNLAEFINSDEDNSGFPGQDSIVYGNLFAGDPEIVDNYASASGSYSLSWPNLLIASSISDDAGFNDVDNYDLKLLSTSKAVNITVPLNSYGLSETLFIPEYSPQRRLVAPGEEMLRQNINVAGAFGF